MKHFFLVFFLFLAGSSLSAQLKRSNIWPLGMQVGLDFSNGSPAVISTAATYTEASSAICDTLGNLLFYTDGLTVYDSTNTPMPNGSGVLGCSSSSQGALIVPFPQHPDVYYVFTTSCYEFNFSQGARYAIVDMSLHNGLGDVTLKNQLISADVAEELAATYHSNNCDVWITMHERITNNFRSYLLTDTGLVNPPVISSVGPNYVPVDDTYGRTMLKFNRSGTLAAQTARSGMGLQILHFDRSAGTFSTFLSLPPSPVYYDPYAACFAPNDSLLYVTARYYSGSNLTSFILQYDLMQSTAQQVADSVVQLTFQQGNPNFGQMQLGADGKIYFSQYQFAFLGAIQNPNARGMGCNPDRYHLGLGGLFSQYGMPNFVSQFIASGQTMGCSPAVNIMNPQPLDFQVYPNPSQGQVTFDIEQNQRLDCQITIADMLGRNVRTYTHIVFPMHIDASDLPHGIYAYQLRASNEVIGSGKLILE
jgi:hypothetical protein